MCDTMGKKKSNDKGMKKTEIEGELPEELQGKIEPIDAELHDDKVIVWKDFEKIYEPGYYGKTFTDRLELSLIEALLLVKRGRLNLKKDKKTVNFEDLYKHAASLDERLPERYRVYEDLRERGLLVRTGFKFGCDFRVYDRGVQLKKGPKSAKEHTKWIVFAVSEDYTCSFQELSRAVRLAHNIRAKMLWAVVDSESDCTYYQVVREKV
jgi:tRNA-intron endonuclease, archaea type